MFLFNLKDFQTETSSFLEFILYVSLFLPCLSESFSDQLVSLQVVLLDNFILFSFFILCQLHQQKLQEIQNWYLDMYMVWKKVAWEIIIQMWAAQI